MSENLNAVEGESGRAAWIAAYKAAMRSALHTDESALHVLAQESWLLGPHLDPVRVAQAENIRSRTLPDASQEEWRSVGYAAGLAGLPRQANPHSRREASPTSTRDESTLRDERRRAWDGGWSAAVGR